MRGVFVVVGVLAMLAGAGSWFAASSRPRIMAPAVPPAGILTAAFRTPGGEPASLAPYRGKVVVINFWATWCAPCREEMPSFSRLQKAWSAHNVQFVGLSSDDPARVRRFLATLPVSYPILVGPAVDDWARKLGDVDGLLPFTLLLRPDGSLEEAHVGIYSEASLQETLARLAR